MTDLLQNAELWIAIGLAILIVVLVAAKVPGAAMKALDAKAAAIQTELDEATRLREEAQALLTSLTARHAESEALAKEMLVNAQAEVKRLEVEAKAKLEEQIQRRAELAERRISNAEAQATAEVKAAASDVAARMAEAVLAARIAKAKSDPLIDAAIAQVGTRLK